MIFGFGYMLSEIPLISEGGVAKVANILCSVTGGASQRVHKLVTVVHICVLSYFFDLHIVIIKVLSNITKMKTTKNIWTLHEIDFRTHKTEERGSKGTDCLIYSTQNNLRTGNQGRAKNINSFTNPNHAPTFEPHSFTNLKHAPKFIDISSPHNFKEAINTRKEKSFVSSYPNPISFITTTMERKSILESVFVSPRREPRSPDQRSDLESVLVSPTQPYDIPRARTERINQNPIIAALKSNNNSPILPNGQQFQMPNNIFNSEDRTIKFEKSDSSFHLYRYVIHEELNQTTKHMTNHFQRFFVNKQRIEKTRENRHSWNSILNELRLKIKREAEKGVIL